MSVEIQHRYDGSFIKHRSLWNSAISWFLPAQIWSQNMFHILQKSLLQHRWMFTEIVCVTPKTSCCYPQSFLLCIVYSTLSEVTLLMALISSIWTLIGKGIILNVTVKFRSKSANFIYFALIVLCFDNLKNKFW